MSFDHRIPDVGPRTVATSYLISLITGSEVTTLWRDRNVCIIIIIIIIR